MDKPLPISLLNIKTDDSDADDNDADGIACNTVMLLEENVKEEPFIQIHVASEDPLNIIQKQDVKIPNPRSSPIEFKGEFDEIEFLNKTADATESSAATEGTNTRRNKRLRLSAGSEYKCENGYTWSTEKPEMEIPKKNKNDFNRNPITPQGKGPARLVANVLEAWLLLIDEPMLQNLLKYTNDEIKKRRGVNKQASASHQRSTDINELRAWIGLNYLCGVFCAAGSTPLEEFWTPELGNGIFRANMPLKRFEFLRDCLALNEKRTIKSSKLDAAARIKIICGIWEKFIINCRSYYAPSGNCTLSEHLIEMRDTDCPTELILHIPEVGDNHGLRLISLHDAKTLYMCNALIGHEVLPLRDEVLALTCDIKGTERNVTLPQRYTTLEWAKSLRQSKLTLVGCLSSKSQDIPKEMVKKKKKPNEAQNLYSGENVLLTIGDNNVTEILLSSGLTEQINAERLYSVTAQAGKRFYETAATFSTANAFKSGRSNSQCCTWTLRFFHQLLDYACINAWLLFRLSTQMDRGDSSLLQHRDFQRQLGLFLTQQHLKRRLQRNSKLSLQLKLLICEILGEPIENLLAEAVIASAQANSVGAMPIEQAKIPSHIQLLPKTTPKRGRCRCCPSKNNIKTRWQCQQCARALCLSHLIVRCSDCTGLPKQPRDVEKDAYFK